MFDSVNFGDFLRWSDTFFQKWHWLPDVAIWEDEPNCVFEVIGLDTYSEDKSIEFECVTCCGQHNVTSLTQSEYEDYSLILGAELMQFVDSISNLAELVAPSEEQVFNFVEEEERIYKMIQNESLPS